MPDEEKPDARISGGATAVSRQLWQQGKTSISEDWVATETAIALVYNCVSHAVMMATPADFEDFALGFSLSENILQSPDQLLDIEVRDEDNGIVIEMSIPGQALDALKQRRRSMVGRTGCGVCGAETIEQAIQMPHVVTDKKFKISHQAIQNAVNSFPDAQGLRNKTGAVHAAMWCDLNGKVVLLREDVGRHNALDKLIGALAKSQFSKQGFVLITSRASYEMVSKVASANIQLLVAVSAPTSLAIDMARESGVSLVGFGRASHHAVYHGAEKLMNDHEEDLN